MVNICYYILNERSNIHFILRSEIIEFLKVLHELFPSNFFPIDISITVLHIEYNQDQDQEIIPASLHCKHKLMETEKMTYAQKLGHQPSVKSLKGVLG